MASPRDERPDDDGASPAEQLDPMEVEEPRREASARFVVDKIESSSASMRAAMDPANQSLGEALRLSYRVLQVAILALVVTFLFSGFQSVREGSTGVKTMFGKIVEGADGAQLSPGLTPFWPYPIGELLVFDQKRPIKLDREFQPRETPNAATKEQQVDQAGDNRELIAERDGWVMTASGDIAHVSLAAEYAITDAVEFVTKLDPERAGELVRKALMRGTVQAASKFTLEELTQSGQAPASEVQLRTQEVLDRLGTGITITSITFVERSPPRFVDAKFRDVQAKRESAKTVVEQARQRVTATLTGMAGATAFAEITDLIREYDASLVRNDIAAADALFEKIGARFEAPDVSGEVARIIQQARGESAMRLAALQKEYTRLEGLAPAFRENPRQLVRQLWLDAVRSVMGGKEIEVISPPDALSQLVVKVKSSQDIMQLRRAMALARKKAEQEAQQIGDFMMGRGSQISIGKSQNRVKQDTSSGTGRDDIHPGAPGG